MGSNGRCATGRRRTVLAQLRARPIALVPARIPGVSRRIYQGEIPGVRSRACRTAGGWQTSRRSSSAGRWLQLLVDDSADGKESIQVTWNLRLPTLDCTGRASRREAAVEVNPFQCRQKVSTGNSPLV